MSTYTKDLKKAEKAFKKRMRIEKIEYLQRLEDETKRKENMFFLLLNEEKENNKRLEIEHRKEIERIRTILDEYANKLNYREWLTLRDYLTKDYIQIESDLNRGKIDNNIVDRIKEIAGQ